ncbi:hypothetical protein AVEN_72398-1 [Araneus ventricosus]|uniref:DUF4371 domain-containing protein n=1 Tax=Araneus ventricosus TaxID=182803 RepID=A0A4Y2XBD0_ARAVE|nr:hypothetical protein AVEN_72398-1 [Araneus ventricosus]
MSVTPVSGTGSDIVKCILKYLEDNDVDINELEAIGCDGTVTNTGWKNGVIRNIELNIQRPLQFIYCYKSLTVRVYGISSPTRRIMENEG